MSAATLPNHVANLRQFHWLPLRLFFRSLSKIIVIEDCNCRLSNLPCRGLILSETRSVSLISASPSFFFYFARRRHYNVVKICYRNGRQDGQESNGGCRFCRVLTLSYSDVYFYGKYRICSSFFLAVFVLGCVVFYACSFGMHPIDNVIDISRVTSTFTLNV